MISIDPARRRSGGLLQSHAPDLYLGTTCLDPTITIDASDVRHGALLGLRGPSAHQESEPQGLAEVRISSGRGAGRVHRLGIGSASVGSGQHCAIRLEDDDVPEEVARLEVDREGTIRISPADGTVNLTIPAPLRREPATEPIVLQAARSTPTRCDGAARRSGPSRIGDRIDPMADVPMIHLDRRPITDDEVVWHAGEVLGVGHVLLERVEVTEPDASLSRSPSLPELDYNRPPRLHPPRAPRSSASRRSPDAPTRCRSRSSW